MKSVACFCFIPFCLLPIAGATPQGSGEGVNAEKSWRSELYPEDWKPGYANEAGYSLRDFSYAGYQSGEVEIPDDIAQRKIFNVLETPFYADANGINDSTDSIRAAIQAAEDAGGGVVFLPEGVYRVSPGDGAERAVFHIGSNNVTIRGEGPERTFIVNTDPEMRSTSVFWVSETIRDGGPPYWFIPLHGTIKVTADIDPHQSSFLVADASSFSTGDWIAIREDVTEDFVDGFGVEGLFSRLLQLNLGQVYLRKITDIQPEQNRIHVDIPFHTFLRESAGLRAYQVSAPLQEVGIEELSIGMRINQETIDGSITRRGASPGGEDVEDWIYFSRGIERGNWNELLNSETSSLYQLHQSYLITFEHVANSWIRNVHTFRPQENPVDVHLLSNGIRLDWSRQITVTGCELSNTAFVGGGGNGYGISLGGQDILIENTGIHRFRRPVSHRFRSTNGNVVLQSTFTDSIGADWHMWLSPANLMDSVTLDNCLIEAKYRGLDHGFGTTETVIWNTHGRNYRQSWYAPDEEFIIDTCQAEHGYVIGTSGEAFVVRANQCDNLIPDWIEGIGMGNTLIPQSLYLDQLERRLNASRE